MLNRIKQWFWGTWLGGKYLEFLLWLDDQNESQPVISHKEVQQIVIQAQQMLYTEGIRNIKKKVNGIVTARTKEEYDAKLKELEDLMPLAEGEKGELSKLKSALLAAHVRHGKDIKTDSDHARMINKRIGDYQELREANEKRRLIRDIRRHRKLGNDSVADQLEQEFKKRYARRY